MDSKSVKRLCIVLILTVAIVMLLAVAAAFVLGALRFGCSFFKFRGSVITLGAIVITALICATVIAVAEIRQSAHAAKEDLDQKILEKIFDNMGK